MKALIIAWKDVVRRFRDPRALLFMLLTPLVIAFIMGAAFSGQENDNSPVYAIPLVVFNADEGDLSAEFLDIIANIEVKTLEGKQPLFVLQSVEDETLAREQVERGEASAALLLPANFSHALQAQDAPTARLQLLTDPTEAVAPLVAESVVRRVALHFESAALGARLVIGALAEQESAVLSSPTTIALAVSEAAAHEAGHARIQWQEDGLGAARELNLINYFMPSMAIFFLMFSVFSATRSILVEEKQGVFARLLTTPASRAEILAGKMGGALFGGWLQMAVLVLASTLLFNVCWGDPLAVALLTLVTVMAAAGLGGAIAAFARDDDQANLAGSLITLVFAVLGGNFIPLHNAPAWLDALSRLTLNRWALDAFSLLSFEGASLPDIGQHLLVLGGMSLAAFLVAWWGLGRRFAR